MHVKYASRQVVYSLPNVFDCILGFVAARAGRDIFVDVRAMLILLLDTGDWPVRAIDFAARETVVVFAVRAGTDVRTFDVVRALVVRGVETVARAVAAREVVDWVVVLRGLTVVRETAVLGFLRATVFSSRTAALAMPTLTMYAIIKIQAFFIPYIYRYYDNKI